MCHNNCVQLRNKAEQPLRIRIHLNLYLNHTNHISSGHKFKSQHGNITLMEIDHEIISAVILLLQLIQEGQLSVTGESLCTNTG